MLGSDWWKEEVSVRETEAAGRSVAVKQDVKVAGRLVVKGFVGEEDD